MIEALTELPAALPCHFMGVRCARAVEYPLAVNRTEVRERVAKCPAFFQCRPESANLAVSVGIEVRARHIVVVLLAFGFAMFWDVCRTEKVKVRNGPLSRTNDYLQAKLTLKAANT